jgi:hypothetical protein
MRIPMALILCLAAAPAAAQVRPYGPGAYGTTGDIHRYEMDRLRARSDANEALARRQALETRLTLLELRARRQVTPLDPPAAPAARTPEQERSLRQAATARRETTAAGVGQIDAWLDRRPQ